MVRQHSTGYAVWAVAAVVGAVVWAPAASWAQANQFGGQDRADAATRMIVLGVQQGVASLPPTSGQSFAYEFDPGVATFVPTERLGPTVFRAPETIGRGKFSLRLAASYFELKETFDPINYFIQAPQDPAFSSGVAKLGLTANAKVGVVNFSAGYGITDRIEVNLTYPMVVVDAHASQTFSTDARTLGTPARKAPLSGAATKEELDQLLRGGALTIRSATFKDLGFQFNEGTHFGIGRISVGGKAVLYADQHLQLAFAPEFFAPSPNEEQFAGSQSPAILPRLIGAVRVLDMLRLRADAGYDYDFNEPELRRFVWNAGASVPAKWVAFDLGIGGSQYDTAIEWTPTLAHGRAEPPFPATTLTAAGDNSVGDTFIDFLIGAKARLTDYAVVSVAASAPVNDEGFRAPVQATGSVEFYF